MLVSWGRFSYNGEIFYVEVKGSQYARMESRGLFTLLTSPYKDTSGSSFYQAQCVHYGLKEYRTKSVAKKYLLAAFKEGTDTIDVPSHILALEQNMKDHFWKKIREVEKTEEQRQEEERQMAVRQRDREEDVLLKEFAKRGIAFQERTESSHELSLRTLVPATDTDAELRENLARLPKEQLHALVERLVFDEATPANRYTALKELDAMRRSKRPASAMTSDEATAANRDAVVKELDTTTSKRMKLLDPSVNIEDIPPLEYDELVRGFVVPGSYKGNDEVMPSRETYNVGRGNNVDCGMAGASWLLKKYLRSLENPS